MAEKKRGCPECSSPTMHKLTCSRRPGGPNHRKLERAPKTEKASRPAPARVAARVLKEGPRGDDGGFDLGAASVDELVALIVGCQGELRHRRERLVADAAAIEKALGSAAA